ncbi:MAG: tyrosine-type recombinase/integrase [Patescibacteria group bacterium]|nr:tyrosine-type recombinase/integrase [Patescibacteria group bacterium]
MKIGDFFGGLLEHKKAQNLNQKTFDEYKRLWEKVLIPSGVPDIEIDRLKKNDVDKILLAGQQHGMFGGQRGVVLRQLLEYIRGEGHATSVNWWEISLPTVAKKEVDWLDQDEWQKVRNAFNLNWIIGIRDRALVEILHASGMRIGEALSLNRDTIVWEKREAEIIGGKKPYKPRKVYFTDESLQHLKNYLDLRNDNFPPLFVSLTGQRASPAGVRRTIHTAMKLAGIKKRIHPHIFRSTFATELLHGRTDIKSVQALCGHESERTTLRYYAAVSKSRCKEEHQRVMNKPYVVKTDYIKQQVWKITPAGLVEKSV